MNTFQKREIFHEYLDKHFAENNKRNIEYYNDIMVSPIAIRYIPLCINCNQFLFK